MPAINKPCCPAHQPGSLWRKLATMKRTEQEQREVARLALILIAGMVMVAFILAAGAALTS